MEILDAEVNWSFDYANTPELRIWVDDVPDLGELTYEKKYTAHNTYFYWAEQDSYVNFYISTPNKQGYGGRTFHPKMKDGTIDNVKGPWSSDTYGANQYFPASVGCVMYCRDSNFPQLGISGAILLPLARDICAMISSELQCKIEMKEVFFCGATHWVPVWTDNPCEHSEPGPNGRCIICKHKIYVDHMTKPILVEIKDSEYAMREESR